MDPEESYLTEVLEEKTYKGKIWLKISVESGGCSVSQEIQNHGIFWLPFLDKAGVPNLIHYNRGC